MYLLLPWVVVSNSYTSLLLPWWGKDVHNGVIPLPVGGRILRNVTETRYRERGCTRRPAFIHTRFTVGEERVHLDHTPVSLLVVDTPAIAPW